MLNKMKLAIIDNVYAFLSDCWIHRHTDMCFLEAFVHVYAIHTEISRAAPYTRGDKKFSAACTSGY